MAGDTEMAFRLYEDMQADKVKTDPCVYTSLISTCSNKILRSGPDSRREQLVLLERAFSLFTDMKVGSKHYSCFCFALLLVNKVGPKHCIQLLLLCALACKPWLFAVRLIVYSA